MKVILFANTEWYLYNFRRALALALRDEGYDLLLISPPGEYGKKLQKLGFRWQSLPMDRRSLNPIHELVLFWHLIKLFWREKPTLVHCFTIKCAIYGSLAARLTNVPARINAVAGMGYIFSSNDFKARLLRPLVSMLLRLALGGNNTRLILQNPDDVVQFVDSALIKKNYIHLIRGSGVDLTRFVPSTNIYTNERPLRVLLASRLLWEKGIAEYVGAARQLKSQNINTQFLLAGLPDPGNPSSVPQEDIQSWVDEGLIEWLGHVDDMPNLLQSVDIFVLPSFYREGTPRSLIEAAGCAKALITTDMPGCREVVNDGIDGLLIPTRSATALAQAIIKFKNNPDLIIRLGNAAREKALLQFDEKIVIKNTIDVYKEVFEKNKFKLNAL